jgi:hypothetical protein
VAVAGHVKKQEIQMAYSAISTIHAFLKARQILQKDIVKANPQIDGNTAFKIASAQIGFLNERKVRAIVASAAA